MISFSIADPNPETHESETHANVVVIPVAGTGAVAMLLSYLVRQSVKK